MILLISIAAGWLVGVVRALLADRPYQLDELAHPWLVPAAVIPQILIFQIPLTARLVSDQMAAGMLVISQMILMAFVFLNWKQIGLKVLGIGLMLNLLVIFANGGLMPIAPETVQALYPDFSVGALEIGARVGTSKNILLPVAETHLAGFSDAVLLPDWFPWNRALSFGDLLIAIGAFWLLAADPAAEGDGLSTARAGSQRSNYLLHRERTYGDKTSQLFQATKKHEDRDWF